MQIIQIGTSKTKDNSFFNSKEFYEFMFSRIEKKLDEDAEYMEMHKDYIAASKIKDFNQCDKLSGYMEVKSQEISYIQGWKDAVAMLMGSLS